LVSFGVVRFSTKSDLCNQKRKYGFSKFVEYSFLYTINTASYLKPTINPIKSGKLNRTSKSSYRISTSEIIYPI